MSKDFKNVVKELNEFLKKEQEGMKTVIIIHSFNKSISVGQTTTLYKSTKDFKNTVFRLYHGMLKEDMTEEEVRKLYPSRGTKGRVQIGLRYLW